MLQYLIPRRGTPPTTSPSITNSAVRVAETIAAAVGLTAITDARSAPFGREDLVDLFTIAEKLHASGVIQELQRSGSFPDEPRIVQWSAKIGESFSGGMSVSDDRGAIAATLAEAIERHLWRHEIDYARARVASAKELTTQAIALSRFAGYPLNTTDRTIAWIPGYSWVSRKQLFVPAHIVSAAKWGDTHHAHIRETITTGLATAPNRTDAFLGGALEVIERDAFMIMWLNQLSLPRIAPAELAKSLPSLEILLARCARYQLDVTFVSLITDAPAHAVMAVVTDRAKRPSFTIGLSAKQHRARAAEKALLEALRARITSRHQETRAAEPFTKKNNEIRHLERARYWAQRDLPTFLANGSETVCDSGAWETDTRDVYRDRIIHWCRERDYECISIDMSASKKNVTPWYIEFVLIPELQPMHQNEHRIPTHGERLARIPRLFGFAPRAEPFTDEPHPFT